MIFYSGIFERASDFIMCMATVANKVHWISRVVMPMVLVGSINAQSNLKKDVSNDQVGGAPAEARPSVRRLPAMVSIHELADFELLSAERKHLIEAALAVATDFPWLPYLYGGSDPAVGGMDCSGAMYYVMRRAGLVPPRTSAAQYLWLKDHHRLHRIAEDADTVQHPSLHWLEPGDLLFWSTGDADVSGENIMITHVAMYLGREKRDAWKIMINSTDGRSYRGARSNGYGIYDFRIPAKESKSKLIGYGTPPGIAEVIMNPAVVPRIKETKP